MAPRTENRDGLIVLDWVDDTYAFRLGIGQWAELQEACDAGPYFILNRLQDGAWRVEDIWSVIRLGLVGGGMDPAAALKKVKLQMDKPPMQHVQYAVAILTAGLVGGPEEKLGEPDAGEAENRSTISREESSELPNSTEPAPRSATRQRK
jgi:hypothetical protein